MSLAESPPDLPYPKLPFWRTVGLSYSTYFSHFIEALRASWLWLIAAAAVTGVASWQQWTWMATTVANQKPGQLLDLPRPAGIAALLNLDNILLLLAGVSIAVAWHRLMILNEQPGFSGGNLATKNLWRYIFVAIALFLIFFLPAIAVMFPAFYFLPPIGPSSLSRPSWFVPTILLGFAVYAIAIAVTLRLTLLLPARAIGDIGLNFSQTWNRTHGNVWRLFWGIVLATIPPLLIAEVVFFFGVGPLKPLMTGGEDFVAGMTAVSTVFMIYYLLIQPIGIGFLSHAYRHFFQAPLEPA